MPKRVFPEGQHVDDAILDGNLAVVVEFVRGGGNLNGRSTMGSAVTMASHRPQREVVRYLLSIGGDPTVRDRDERDAISYLQSSGDAELVDRALARRGDLSVAGEFSHWERSGAPTAGGPPRVAATGQSEWRGPSARPTRFVGSFQDLIVLIVLLPVFAVGLVFGLGRLTGDGPGDAIRGGVAVVFGAVIVAVATLAAAFLVHSDGARAALLVYLALLAVAWRHK